MACTARAIFMLPYRIFRTTVFLLSLLVNIYFVNNCMIFAFRLMAFHAIILKKFHSTKQQVFFHYI
jgi:hypothetical protein